MDIITSIEVAINGRFLEGVADNTIYPGMLVQHTATGGFEPHSTRHKAALPLIAIENRIAGKGVATPYNIGDIVYVRHCLRGDVFWGGVRFILFQSIRVGDSTSSYGDGSLHPQSGPLAPNDRMLIGRISLVGSVCPWAWSGVDGRWCKIERQ